MSSAGTPCASILCSGRRVFSTRVQYYWVTAQSEYSTDILFRKRADLEELMPRLCQYSAIYFSASDVMSFLGRKLTGHFQDEVVTDQREVEVRGTRVPGRLGETSNEVELDQDVRQADRAASGDCDQ